MEDFEFDVVVCGTNITSSLISVGLAKSGKKVLQIDRSNFYGGVHCTLSFKQLVKSPHSKCINHVIAEEDEKSTETAESEIVADDRGSDVLRESVMSDVKDTHTRNLFLPKSAKPNIFYEISPFSKIYIEPLCEWLFSESSKFAIDFWPKLIYSRSAIVELILKSGSDHYLSFRDNKGPILLGYESGEEIKLNEVVDSKSAVFRSTFLTPLEKRNIMKVISDLSQFLYIPHFSSLSLEERSPENSVQGGRDFKVCEGSKRWLDFLRENKCTKNVIDLLSYGICLGGSDIATWTKIDGLKRLLKYVESIGVFGDSGSCLLYTLYGTADLSQAFCRVSSVHGCTFMLERFIKKIFLDDKSKMHSILLDDGKWIKTKLLICEEPLSIKDPSSSSFETDNNTIEIFRVHDNDFDYRKACDFVPFPYDEIPSDLTEIISLNYGNNSQNDLYLHLVVILSSSPVLNGLSLAVICSQGDDYTSEPIYVLQTNYEEGAAPKDHFLVYLMKLDASKPQEPESFASSENEVLNRLIQCYNGLAKANGANLSSIVMAIYTAHRIRNDHQECLNLTEKHRGFLSDSETESIGIVIVPPLKTKMIVPLLEETTTAVHVLSQLFGTSATPPDVLGKVDLGGFPDMCTHPQIGEEEETALTLLDKIIENFSN